MSLIKTTNPINFTRQDVDWRLLNIAPETKEFLEYIARRKYCSKIKYIVLFGSVAREEATKYSDIDIAVISDDPLSRTELNQLHPSINHSHLYKLDYRIINISAHKLETEKFLDVGYHIKREGIIIYEYTNPK